MTVRTDETEETLEEEETEETTEDEESEEEPEEQPSVDASAIVSEIVRQVSETMETTVDRRINQLMQTLQRDYGIEKRQAQRKQGEPSTDDRLLRRLLRGAVVELIGEAELPDSETRVTARKMALRIAGTVDISDDVDEYEMAEAIVSEVKDELASLRAMHERQVRAELKRRGLLTGDDDDDGGQPPKKPNKPGPDSDAAFKQGKELARRMFEGESEE